MPNMDYRKKFVAEPGAKVRLAKINPSCTGKHSHKKAAAEIQNHIERMEDAGRVLAIAIQAIRVRNVDEFDAAFQQ
jgi:hypothetical protein